MKFSKYSDSFISKNIKNRKRKKVKRKTSVSNKYNSSIIKNEIDPENIIKQNYKSISLRNKDKDKAPPKRRRNKKGKINSFKSIENSTSYKNLLNDNIYNNKREFIMGKTNIFNIKNIKIKNIENKIKLNKNNEDLKIKNKTKTNRKINKKKMTNKNLNQCSINYDIKNNDFYKNLNDYELNILEYEIALVIDKRTYLQYYLSLLKKKQLILFTFFPANDYNLISIKICLFLLSFSLYLTINGFFFSDDTMHKIYIDNGEFNIIYQLPQIFYSSIVPAVINMILKHLSLSEKSIIEIKQEKEFKIMLNFSKKVKNSLLIKFILFFILNFILLFFFWYFITCFCAVYPNTQIILFKDTLISFSISMLYPFGLYLIPGLFRIPSLKAKKKDMEFLYKIGYIISLI